jgi:NADPH:quinone reductase-like Zn-dependent oxidoreductase
MKAAVINKFGDPTVFEIIEIPEPSIKPDEILIEVISASVNPIDWKQRKGNHRFIFGSPFPIILGYDVAGIVKKVGTEVTEFNIGDNVCGVLNNIYGGGLSQFAKGKKNCFAIVPSELDHYITSALPLAGLTALQALRDKTELKSGDRLLIIGAAGGVGSFALQIARIMGAEITVVSSDRHKGYLHKFDILNFIDYQNSNIFQIPERYDKIFDTVGSLSFLKCKKILKSKGIYINTLPRPKILVHKLLSCFTNGKRVKTLLMKHSSSDLAQLLSWMKEGKLKIVIDKEFSINEMASAHKYSEEGHTEGKILIKYNW